MFKYKGLSLVFLFFVGSVGLTQEPKTYIYTRLYKDVGGVKSTEPQTYRVGDSLIGKSDDDLDLIVRAIKRDSAGLQKNITDAALKGVLKEQQDRIRFRQNIDLMNQNRPIIADPVIEPCPGCGPQIGIRDNAKPEVKPALKNDTPVASAPKDASVPPVKFSSEPHGIEICGNLVVNLEGKELQEALRKRSKAKTPAARDKIKLTKVVVKNNNYYEKIFGKFNEHEKKERELEPGDIPRACIEEAQHSFPAKNSYSRCENKSSTPALSGNILRPCISENYTNVIHNAFADTMRCFGVSQRLIYPLIARESGFHINAYNVYQNGGLGQVTDSAIKEINNTYFPLDKKTKLRELKLINQKTERIINADGDRKFCEKIAHRFGGPMSPSPEDRCESMAPPENPIKNFIYIALMAKRNGEYLAGNPSENRLGFLYDDKHANKADENLAQQLEKIKIAGPDLQILLNKLILESHNSGAGNLATALQTYLSIPGRSVTDFDVTQIKAGIKAGDPGNFLNFIKNRFALKTKTAPLNRRKTLASYLKEMLSNAGKFDDYVASQEPDDEVIVPKEGGSSVCVDPSLYH